jgi:hypothetical protein
MVGAVARNLSRALKSEQLAVFGRKCILEVQRASLDGVCLARCAISMALQ